MATGFRRTAILSILAAAALCGAPPSVSLHAAQASLAGDTPAATDDGVAQTVWDDCMDIGDPDRSIGACSLIIMIGEDSRENLAGAYFNRANAYLVTGDLKEAIADYGRSIGLDASNPDAYYNRALAHLDLEEYDRALADLDIAIRLGMDMAAVYRERGWAHLGLGDPDSALADFDRAIAYDDADAQAHTGRGNAHREAGDLASALADYRTAADLLPTTDPLRLDVLVAIGRVEEMLASAAAEPKVASPGHQGSRDADRAACAGPGDPDVIIRACTAVIGAGGTPGDISLTYRLRGRAWGEKEEFERAMADLDRAVEFDPNAAEAYFGRGIVWLATDNDRRAIADFDRAIALDAALGRAYSGRGLALLLSGEVDRGMADLDRAVELSPHEPYTYFMRGRGRYDVGDLRRALADFDAAVALKPDFAAAICDRGHAYEKAGDQVSALADFHKVLGLTAETDPLHANASAAIARIEADLATARSASLNSPGGETPPAYGGTHIATSSIEMHGGTVEAIMLTGAFEPRDDERFAAAASTAGRPVIVLDSPGGDVRAAIEIGETIRLNGLATAVPDGVICTSVCALAWLAGEPRHMGRGALVGFHHPRHLPGTGQSSDSDDGTLVGRYLNGLGLTPPAISYASETSGGETRWLSFEDAERLGIAVKVFEGTP